ncbi:hypothetical protein HMPREF1147_1192 [Selenomonas sp. FOBRC9]|uniref:hypothetical protein n=1 Tax=Selenomonas sp. FOBRC9 TaxID=936573 RepID=UPI00027A635D|nr:hypothetical protein [Selenomonas sp. FOBRC9]EJP28787.1 hypothetical protein HMPREF1147_1192 [Selenomonas sp. FOBRC9]
MDRDTSDRMRCISLAVYMAVSFYFAFDLIFLAVYTLIACGKGGAYGVGVAVPAILVIVPFVPIVKEIPWRRLCLAAGGGFFLLYGAALLLVEPEFLEDRLFEITILVVSYIVIQLVALLLLRYFLTVWKSAGRGERRRFLGHMGAILLFRRDARSFELVFPRRSIIFIDEKSCRICHAAAFSCSVLLFWGGQ